MCYRGVRGVVPTEGIRTGQMTVKFHGWPRNMATQMSLWHIVMAEPLYKRHPLPRQMSLGQCQCHTGVADHGNLWHVREAFTWHDIVVVRWCSTAELTPLRSVRPSYRFLRPRSRENLSPAGTSHFPRPWAGHVRRTAPPDGRHIDESLHPWKMREVYFWPIISHKSVCHEHEFKATSKISPDSNKVLSIWI